MIFPLVMNSHSECCYTFCSSSFSFWIIKKKEQQLKYEAEAKKSKDNISEEETVRQKNNTTIVANCSNGRV